MRVAIIFNPHARQAISLQEELEAAANLWREHGWRVDLKPTAAPDDGIRLARLAVEQQCDMVVAAGGDGTINEVVNGLAKSSTVLGTLPLGTTNIWARELKLPLQPVAAAQEMLTWKARTIDLGRAGERFFLLMAGIGFDAQVTAEVQPEAKKRLGAMAYVLRGIQLAMQTRGTRIHLTLDGKRIHRHVLLVVVGNSQLYGGVTRITNRACINDGLLDVCIIQGDGWRSWLQQASLILSQQHLQAPEIEYYRVSSLHIGSRRRLPVQVDGDPIGQTPMIFEIVPGGIQALMPPDTSTLDMVCS